jgi:general secretion pathway protein E
MSFPAIVVTAALATLALIVVGIWVPAYLVPSVVGMGAVGLAPVVVKFVRARQARAQARSATRATYGVHSPARIKATVEAYNDDDGADVPRLVDYVLQQGVLNHASDVHLVPYKDFVLIRYRVDGILSDVARLGPRLRELVTSRLKVMAQVVIFVRDRPQDGRIDLKVGEHAIDLRVAFMPTLHGERVVMRILDRQELGSGLAGLGFTPEQLAVFSDIMFRPQGMVILNGPTGSGKTTTIYAALSAILEHNHFSSSIYTLEDPIEYDLLNINQTQIEEAQGFTFAHGLRTMLRQDPDVIMVGEIRDVDTSRIAIQAGMTGHLIITTVHAKSAAGVFVRLAEIGVDPHSVASAVTAVVAQRLVRVLCPHCKRPAPATPGQESKLGLVLGGQTFYAPAGCGECNQKGYLGRKGVFEILQVDEAVRELVAARASPDRVHEAALKRGMTTLLENGMRLAREGETSLDEVLRVLPPEQRGA